MILRILRAVSLACWTAPQTIIGAGLWVVAAIRGNSFSYPYTGRTRGGILTIITRTSLIPGAVSLGMFVFIGRGATDPAVGPPHVIKHEYGHTLQSAMLGPLYLLIVGLPSIIRATWWTRTRQRGDYYRIWFEAWANRLGGV